MLEVTSDLVRQMIKTFPKGTRRGVDHRDLVLWGKIQWRRSQKKAYHPQASSRPEGQAPLVGGGCEVSGLLGRLVRIG